MFSPKRDHSLEIYSGSGMLRVTIHPKPSWLEVLFEAIAIVLFSTWVVQGWTSLAFVYKALIAWAAVGTFFGLLYQFSGSEVIEIDAQKLVIEKHISVWTRRKEFAIRDCRNLEWWEGNEDKSPGLRCKVGWRTIRFGDRISENEGQAIIAALQTTMPEVAHQMLAFSGEMKKHFTTLDLT